MGGLNLYAGGFGGVQGTAAPQYGSAKSYSSGNGATGAAFAGPATNVTPTLGATISPTHGFGLAVWLGIGAIAGLVVLRNSLPN